MSLVFCGIVPHPPIAVPAVGKHDADQVKDTQQAMLALAQQIKASGAEALVMISPHSPVFADAIAINVTDPLAGDLARFRAADVAFTVPNQLPLAQAIIKHCQSEDLRAVGLDRSLMQTYNVDPQLDHGVTVPLHFFAQAGLTLPLVVVSPAMFDFKHLYRFGQAVASAATELGIAVALVASGDLSHRLTSNAPAGYSAAAADFDAKIVRLVQEGDAAGLVQIDYDEAEQAAECGLRPIIMMMGALDGREVATEILSYQGPFGVGYLVAALKPGDLDPQRKLGEMLASPDTQESFIVQVARQSLENYVLGKPAPHFNDDQIPAAFKGSGATFVTIKQGGQLRGCIGSIYPQQDTLVEEVIKNAVSAGNSDPRFPPVGREELATLTYSVDVLTSPETVDKPAELNPQRDGIIVQSGHRTGLLLPALAGVDTVEEQLAIAKEKAGIGAKEKFTLEKFQVIRHK